MSQLILLISEDSVSALSQTLCYSLFQISCLDFGNNFDSWIPLVDLG